VAPGSGRGQVAAGVRLGEALAPDHLVAQQRADDLALLLSVPIAITVGARKVSPSGSR
jgi:hypothetical protein